MSEVAEAPKSRALPAPKADPKPDFGLPRLADAGLIVGFLALTFLLGVFPLKDTDFWWHLRAGDQIRQTHAVPTVDTYTFGAEGHRWVDLHWIFQVGLSLGFERFGVAGLNVVKCLVTCLAVGLLVTARKKDWPVWVMLVAWLPFLLVLAGRMYIRPESMTLLYLSAFLAILFRIDDRPWLAFLLPVIQVAWVNTQGLFVLGPGVTAFALIGAAFRPGALRRERRGWWTKVLIAATLTGLACLVNPYFLTGALYPIQLLSTMDNVVFSHSIAELEPVDRFIAKKDGLRNHSLQIQLAAMTLGVLSFVVPILWRIWDRSTRPEPPAPPAKKRARKKAGPTPPAEIQPDVFRFLLFLAFSYLAWKATRNSHQFAAVVGTVTAWNLGEWAAEIARSNVERGEVTRFHPGRVVAAIAIAALFAAVGSGALYAWEAEGRTIGLGEEPHWFPHAAVDFAGRPDMPSRSVCFHEGHAALYEYKYAPERKTYADARLEVVGPELYQRYLDLQTKITRNVSGWEADLDALKRPLVLVDNVHAPMAATTASLLASRQYRCVWFDPVATLFVHESYTGAVQAHAYDFAAWHFRDAARGMATDAEAETMMAKTCWNLIFSLDPKSSGATPRLGWRVHQVKLIWAGLDHAREVQRLDPDSVAGWKWAGMIEAYRDPVSAAEPIPRFKMAFDPVFDLSTVRASYDLRRALARSPDDGNTLVALAGLDLQRGMYESAVALFDRFLGRSTNQINEKGIQEMAKIQRDKCFELLGAPPASLKWANLSELDGLLKNLYDHGRVAAAADLLESAYPPATRPWEVSDRIATIRLHLGEPERAIRAWSEGKPPPSEAIRNARFAAAILTVGKFETARTTYQTAIEADPELFEAHYGLAILEADAGRAAEAMAEARTASKIAKTTVAKSYADRLIESLKPFAGP